MTKEQLKQNYAKAANDYLDAFCQKHDLENDGWIGNDSGWVAHCSDYLVDMQTIIDDINLDAPENDFLKWYDYRIELEKLGVTRLPNFRSWVKGYPRKTEAEIADIRAVHERVEGAKLMLEELINKDSVI